MFGFSRFQKSPSDPTSVPTPNSRTASPRSPTNNAQQQNQTTTIMQITPPTPQSNHNHLNNNNSNFSPASASTRTEKPNNSSSDSARRKVQTSRRQDENNEDEDDDEQNQTIRSNTSHMFVMNGRNRNTRRTSDASVIAQRISKQQQQQQILSGAPTPRQGQSPVPSRSSTPPPQPSLLPPPHRRSPNLSPNSKMNKSSNNNNNNDEQEVAVENNYNNKKKPPSSFMASKFSERALRLSAENFDFQRQHGNTTLSSTREEDNSNSKLAFSIPSPTTARSDRAPSPQQAVVASVPPPRRITTAAGNQHPQPQPPPSPSKNNNNHNNNNMNLLSRQSSSKSLMSIGSNNNNAGRFQRTTTRSATNNNNSMQLPPSLFAQREMLLAGNPSKDNFNKADELMNALKQRRNEEGLGATNQNAANKKRPGSAAALATAAAVVDSGIFAWIVRCSLISTMPIRDLNKFLTDSLRVIDKLVERAAEVSLAHFVEEHERSILEQSFFGDQQQQQQRGNNRFFEGGGGFEHVASGNFTSSHSNTFSSPNNNENTNNHNNETAARRTNSFSLKSQQSSFGNVFSSSSNRNNNNSSKTNVLLVGATTATDNINPLAASPEQRSRLMFLNAQNNNHEDNDDEDEELDEDGAPIARPKNNDMESNYQNLVDDEEVEMAEREEEERRRKKLEEEQGGKDTDSTTTSSSAVSIDPEDDPILFLINPLNVFFEAVKKLPASSFRKYSVTSAFAANSSSSSKRTVVPTKENLKIDPSALDRNLLDLNDSNTVPDVAFYEAVSSLADLWTESTTQREKLRALFSMQQQWKLLVQGSEAVAALSQRSRCIVVQESFFSNPITDAEKIPGLALAVFILCAIVTAVVFFVRSYASNWNTSTSQSTMSEISTSEPNLHNGLIGLYIISFVVLVGSFIVVYRKFVLRKNQMRQILNTILYADTLSGHRLASTTSKNSSPTPQQQQQQQQLSGQQSSTGSFVRHSHDHQKKTAGGGGLTPPGKRSSTNKTSTAFPMSPTSRMSKQTSFESEDFTSAPNNNNINFGENNDHEHTTDHHQYDENNNQFGAMENYDQEDYGDGGNNNNNNTDATTKSILDAVFGTVGGLVWGGGRSNTTNNNHLAATSRSSAVHSRRASTNTALEENQYDHTNTNVSQLKNSSNNLNNNRRVVIQTPNTVARNNNQQNAEIYLEQMPGGIMILPFQSNSSICSAPAGAITSTFTACWGSDDGTSTSMGSPQETVTSNEEDGQFGMMHGVSSSYDVGTSFGGIASNKRSQKAQSATTTSQVQAHGVFRSSHQDNFAPDQTRSASSVALVQQQQRSQVPLSLCFDLVDIHKLLFIVCFDYNYTVTAWNNAAELVTGFLARECIGKKLQEIISIPEEILSSLIVSRIVNRREHVSAHVQSLNTGISTLKGTIVSTYDTDQYFTSSSHQRARRTNHQQYNSNNNSETSAVGFAFISAVQTSDTENRASSLLLNFKNSLARQTLEALSIECRTQAKRNNATLTNLPKPPAPNKVIQSENLAVQVYRHEVTNGIYPTKFPLPPVSMVDVLRYLQALRVLIRGSTWESVNGLARDIHDEWEVLSPEQILSSAVRYSLSKVVDARVNHDAGNMKLPQDLRISPDAIVVARAIVNACPDKCRVVILGEEAGKRTRRLIISVESVASTLKSTSHTTTNTTINPLLATQNNQQSNTNVFIPSLDSTTRTNNEEESKNSQRSNSNSTNNNANSIPEDMMNMTSTRTMHETTNKKKVVSASTNDNNNNNNNTLASSLPVATAATSSDRQQQQQQRQRPKSAAAAFSTTTDMKKRKSSSDQNQQQTEEALASIRAIESDDDDASAVVTGDVTVSPTTQQKRVNLSNSRKRPKSASARIATATAATIKKTERSSANDLLSLNDNNNNQNNSTSDHPIAIKDDNLLPHEENDDASSLINHEKSYSELLGQNQQQNPQAPLENSVNQKMSPLLQTNSSSVMHARPFDFDALLTEVWEPLARASGVLVPSSDVMSVMLYLPCISSKLFAAESSGVVPGSDAKNLFASAELPTSGNLKSQSFVGGGGVDYQNNSTSTSKITDDLNATTASISGENNNNYNGKIRRNMRTDSFVGGVFHPSAINEFNYNHQNNNNNNDINQQQLQNIISQQSNTFFAGGYQQQQQNGVINNSGIFEHANEGEEAKCPISVAMLFDNAVDVHNLTTILFSIKNVSIAVCQSEKDLINRLPFCDLILVDWELLPEIEEKKPVLKKQLYVLPCVSQDWEPLEAGMESQVIFRPFDRKLIVSRIVEASELVYSNREEERKEDERQRVWTQRNDAPWTRGRLLGKGSFGVVYEAINDMTGGVMAVKCFDLQLMRDRAAMDGDPDAQFERILQSLMNEIQILCKLSHPHIVHYFYSEKTDNSLNLFMEMCDRSLQDIISVRRLNRGKLEFAAPTIARQTLQAVAYLHDKGIIHRDLKPMNILLRGDTLKLTDFGTAAQLTSTNEQLTGTQGTFRYMSPEVFKGESYNASCDIWSLGCIMADVLNLNLEFMNEVNPMMMNYDDITGDDDNNNNTDEDGKLIPSRGSVKLPPVSATFSAEARDFVSLCLQVRADDRPLASALLLHPYVDVGGYGDVHSSTMNHEVVSLSTLKGGERKTVGGTTSPASGNTNKVSSSSRGNNNSASNTKGAPSRATTVSNTTTTAAAATATATTTANQHQPPSTTSMSPTPRNFPENAFPNTIDPTPRNNDGEQNPNQQYPQLFPRDLAQIDTQMSNTFNINSNRSVFQQQQSTQQSPLSFAPTPREQFENSNNNPPPPNAVASSSSARKIPNDGLTPSAASPSVHPNLQREGGGRRESTGNPTVHSSVLSSTSGFIRQQANNNNQNQSGGLPVMTVRASQSSNNNENNNSNTNESQFAQQLAGLVGDDDDVEEGNQNQQNGNNNNHSEPSPEDDDEVVIDMDDLLPTTSTTNNTNNNNNNNNNQASNEPPPPPLKPFW